jgi:fatty acid desaturase
MTLAEKPRLDACTLHAVHEPQRWRHTRRLLVFVLLYASSAGAAWWLAGLASRNSWAWMLAVPWYVLAAASLHGISLFTHEAVHGTLARHRGRNAVIGAACAIPVLQNYTAYAVLHLRHHAHLGEDRDPDHYAAYTRWTWLIFVMNWLRLLIGYPIYITMIPILGWKHGTWRDRAGIAAEVAAIVTAVILLWRLPLPAGLLWHGWCVPMLVINFMVNVRGMSQHTLLSECTDEVRGTRSILTSRLVAFFMCNENYHLEHHLYPGVPWYHLPRVHHVLKAELKSRGAPYIRSYFAFVCEFIRGSFARSPAGRWARR